MIPLIIWYTNEASKEENEFGMPIDLNLNFFIRIIVDRWRPREDSNLRPSD